jgi:hypothetical protein
MSKEENKSGLQGLNRNPRAKTTREKTAQRKPWTPPQQLDAPPAPEGFKHRWIRAEVRGQEDRQNISARLREGYELVRRDEYPDFEAPVADSGQFEGVFSVGGLVLARIPLETVRERNEYFASKNADQIEAIDHDLMRENAHPTMTIGKPERQSRVTFGGGSAPQGS